MQIKWDNNIEPKAKAQLEDILADFNWIIPDWLNVLSITVQPDGDEGARASISVDYTYRFATMVVHSFWFHMEERARRETLLHELIHLHTNPMFDYALNVVERLASDEASSELLRDEITAKLEIATVDLTTAILKKESK